MTTREEIVEALKRVKDPELGLDIWSLGLVYEARTEEKKAKIKMTLTSPMCPYGPQLLAEVKQRVAEVRGIEQVEVELTFEPPWEPSEEVKVMLGIIS